MDYRVFPPEEMPEDDVLWVNVPQSKSVLNRLLIINAASGNHVPPEVLESLDGGTISDDTAILARILAEPLPTDGRRVDVGAAGTVMRFLTALIAATEGAHAVLDGVERMRCRPIKELVECLRILGADIKYTGEEGFPPIEIRGRKLMGGSVEMDGSVSSQFTSALLMAAPLMASPLKLTLTGEIASESYLKMTMGVMERASVAVDRDVNVFAVEPGSYRMTDEIFASVCESDWSSASYFYETAAMWGCEVGVSGLKPDSLQGDKACAEIFHRLGVESQWEAEGVVAQPSPEIFSFLELDMTDTPDLVPAVAVAACMMRVPWRMAGVKNLRIKECDRIAALITELGKIGFELATEHYDEVLVWEGRQHPVFELPEIETYGDHRIAMAFAPVSIFAPGLVIKDVDVVAKSFPMFWQQLAKLGFTFTDANEPLQTPDAEEE